MESVKHQWNEQIPLLSPRWAVGSFSSSVKFHRLNLNLLNLWKQRQRLGFSFCLTNNMKLSSKLDGLSIEQHWEREMPERNPTAGSAVGFIASVLWAPIFYHCQHTTPAGSGSNSSSISASQGGQPSSWFTKTVTASCPRGYFHENGVNRGFF